MFKMRAHPVRKFLGLTVLYAVVIIGIFVIQFKTESIITKNVGIMKISLAQGQNENDEIYLKNQFQVTFKGLVFASDSISTVSATSASQNDRLDLVLAGYEQIDDYSFTLYFNKNASINFYVTSLDEEADLYISAILPEDADYLILPLKTDKTLQLQPLGTNRLLTSSKTGFNALTAYEATEDSIIFSKTEHMASYAPFDPTRKFSYDTIRELADTQEFLSEDAYKTRLKQIKARLIPAINQLLSSANADSITEQQVAAYVAEMAVNGRWTEALENIPDSFKRGTRRTYFTAPYFNNLASMNRSLVIETERFASITQSAADAKNLDVFTVNGITDYILREKNSQTIKQILAVPAEMETFEPKLQQIAGILNVYTSLYKKDFELSENLREGAERCINYIEEQCALSGEDFTLEGLENLSITDKIILSKAFIEMGNIKGKSELKDFAYVIFNRGVPSADQIDIRTICELYPYLAPENTYYPHTEILGYYGNTAVWAWTCASSITYNVENSGIANINIDFPLGNIHYIIFNGIPTFHGQIEIQRQMFRTDPRFETYNSSGYVYQTDTKTLLIKSRHKSQVELIRLFCDPAANFSKK